MKKTSLLSRMVLAGIVLGVTFPIFAIVIDLYVKDLPWEFAAIQYLFFENPVHWVVATAPVVLGCVFYVLGRMIGKRQEQLRLVLSQEKQNTEAIRDVLKTFYAEQSTALGAGGLAAALEKFKTQYQADREHEKQQRWESKGMASLSEMLYATDDVEELCRHIVKFLVTYCGLSQGALFVVAEREDDRWLELKSKYATGNEAELTKDVIVPIGSGMVGQCFSDQKMVMLDRVPRDYLKITSGLGASDVTTLIILPLQNEVYQEGVLEMAGFKRLEDFEIAFLQKAAGTSASAFHNLRVNNITRDLLEASQQQTEEMRAQEEEMRQTMEELTATQEEVFRKEKEYIKRIEELELSNSDHERKAWEYKHQLEQLRAQLDPKS